MKLKKKIFYTKKVKGNEYIIYNSKKHIPLKLDDVGKKYFDVILKYNSIKECLQNISKTEHKDFKNFYDTLKKIDFLSDIEEHIDMSLKFNKFEEANILFYLHLTDRCNLKCTYCYNKEQRINLKDLDFNDWKIIIDKIIPYAANILLTGGEVLLHKSIKEIIQYIKDKDKNIKISLISNGSLDYEELNLENTFQIVDRIFLSCDNIKDDKHERIGFNRKIFLKNIDYLKKLKHTTKISLGSVWTKDGIESLEHLEKFCEEKGLPCYRTVCIPSKPEEKEIGRMCSVKDHNNYLKKCNIARTTSDNIEENINIGSVKTISCNAGSATFGIDAKGDCFPCQTFRFPEFKLGNLVKDDFRIIYYSPIASMLRIANNVNNREKCKDCNLKYLCGGGCIADAYKMEGNLFAHPKIMCPYYKNGAKLRLEQIAY